MSQKLCLAHFRHILKVSYFFSLFSRAIVNFCRPYFELRYRNNFLSHKVLIQLIWKHFVSTLKLRTFGTYFGTRTLVFNKLLKFIKNFWGKISASEFRHMFGVFTSCVRLKKNFAHISNYLEDICNNWFFLILMWEGTFFFCVRGEGRNQLLNNDFFEAVRPFQKKRAWAT